MTTKRARAQASPPPLSPRILCCSVSAAGAVLATRLPYEHQPGQLAETVRARWNELDGVVLIGAVGLAVRVIAPLLDDKRTDPAVVVLDDAGRFCVALAGGHQGGANALAREVAGLTGATPVITTATDGHHLVALDDLPGFRAAGDVAGLTRRWLDGTAPTVGADPHLQDWPAPAALTDLDHADLDHGTDVTITDLDRRARPGEVLLRPSSLVVGVGASTGADAKSLSTLIDDVAAGAGVDVAAISTVATIDKKADEPAIGELAVRLGVPVVAFTAPALAAAARERRVPNPSPVVDAAVGTPSVAEAAALLAAGPGSRLIAPKQVSATADSTVALARRARPPGHLAVVGLGPGRPQARTPEAAGAVRSAEVVIGYSAYVDLAGDLIRPSQLVIRSPIGAEAERCRDALQRAAAGARVALVCSGDPGVYAMASLVCELAPGVGDPPVTMVPGITAALSGAAVLGAPLGHDHAAISLSDLLTPWAVIVRRIQAAAEGDFVVSLYNPRSQRRSTQLAEALTILAAHRPQSTPAAILTDVGRPGEAVVRATLSTLDPEQVGMLSLVVVGSSTSRWIGSRMVTPRGYPRAE